MRYVHSLAKWPDDKGWKQLAEFDQGDVPGSMTFLLPAIRGKVNKVHAFEYMYWKDKDVSKTTLKRTATGYEVKIKGFRITFSVVEEEAMQLLPYIGKYQHPDLVGAFTAIEVDDHDLVDRLCEEEGIILIGCCHYHHYK